MDDPQPDPPPLIRVGKHPTHCPNGHPLKPEFRSVVKGRYGTSCRICVKERQTRYRNKAQAVEDMRTPPGWMRNALVGLADWSIHKMFHGMQKQHSYQGIRYIVSAKTGARAWLTKDDQIEIFYPITEVVTHPQWGKGIILARPVGKAKATLSALGFYVARFCARRPGFFR